MQELQMTLKVKLKTKGKWILVSRFSHFLLTRSWEEGEDDARSACPFDILGYTHNTMAVTTGCDGETLS